MMRPGSRDWLPCGSARRLTVALLALCVLGLVTLSPRRSLSTPGDAPAWGAAELRGLFLRITEAGRLPRTEDQDAALASVAGLAYRAPPRQGAEPVDAFAKRVLKIREPNHPTVKKGQWLSALMRALYEDASKRSDLLARFEKDRNDRNYFAQMAKETKTLADVLAKDLETSFEGVDGFVAPLAVASTCEALVSHGAQASVRDGAITIENLERVRFKQDAPPPDVIRTAQGAIREVFSAQKQYNISAEMLGMYEATWRKNRGQLRVMIPGAAPSIYLNELARGATEAGMHTLHVLVTSKGNELCELALRLVDSTTKGKKPKKRGAKSADAHVIDVHCPDDAPMQKCIDGIIASKREGPVRFRPE